MPDISVLGLIEDGEWCAIALEMSLRGYGTSFDDALRDLKDAIRAQITFALENGTIDKIFLPAEQKYLDLYATAIRERAKAGLGIKEHESPFEEGSKRRASTVHQTARMLQKIVTLPRPRRTKEAFTALPG